MLSFRGPLLLLLLLLPLLLPVARADPQIATANDSLVVSAPAGEIRLVSASADVRVQDIVTDAGLADAQQILKSDLEGSLMVRIRRGCLSAVARASGILGVLCTRGRRYGLVVKRYDCTSHVG